MSQDQDPNVARFPGRKEQPQTPQERLTAASKVYADLKIRSRTQLIDDQPLVNVDIPQLYANHNLLRIQFQALLGVLVAMNVNQDDLITALAKAVEEESKGLVRHSILTPGHAPGGGHGHG